MDVVILVLHVSAQGVSDERVAKTDTLLRRAYDLLMRYCDSSKDLPYFWDLYGLVDYKDL